jgi:hypothetical protein
MPFWWVSSWQTRRLCSSFHRTDHDVVKQASVPSPTSRATVRQLHLTAAPVDTSATPSKQSSGPFKVDPMDRHACEALADVLCLDWGLDRLTLENGVLDGDDVSLRSGIRAFGWPLTIEPHLSGQCLKPILHALLVSGSLPHLSLAGNKKLKPQSFRILSAYLRKVRVVAWWRTFLVRLTCQLPSPGKSSEVPRYLGNHSRS